MQLLMIFAAALTLAVPGRSNATANAAAEGSFVVVSFSATTMDGTADIYAAVSRDGAKTFGTPTRVNNAAGDARANGEQPPRVALTRRPDGDPAITIVWTAKGRAGTRLVSARSLDGGRSFAPALAVPDSDTVGNRGWHNVLARRDGRVFAIWLDHREIDGHAMAGAPNHEHGGSQKMDGVAMAQQSKLYIGAIDGSVAPHPVTGGVCYCCKTAIAEGANGSIVASWRHVYPGSFRDIAFTISSDGGRTFAAPTRVSEDRWMLEGCPDDGPAMVVDARNTIHIVWPTVISDEKSGEPTLAIFYTKSTDGRTFTPRTRLPTQGVAHHPQVVLDAHNEPFIAWDESGDGARRIVVSSAPSFKRQVIGDGPGVYPSLASASTGTVAAWTYAQPSGSVIRVAILDAPTTGVR